VSARGHGESSGRARVEEWAARLEQLGRMAVIRPGRGLLLFSFLFISISIFLFSQFSNSYFKHKLDSDLKI
jgi:hypothetical protein